MGVDIKGSGIMQQERLFLALGLAIAPQRSMWLIRGAPVGERL
jgi:hypothetical protein